MTYIQILEQDAEISDVFKNIIAAEHIENIAVNEKDCGETDLLCIAKPKQEVDLRRYGKLKIIIAGLKDTTNIKNISSVAPHVQIITCGWEDKDTFTYSSVNEDEVILNLQRKITALNGAIITPCEVKAVRGKYGIGGQEDESVLFAFCIYLCLGNGNNSL